MQFYNNIFADTPQLQFEVQTTNAQEFLRKNPNPYVGNKKKILADIGNKIYKHVDFSAINTICDLFAGSAVVSAFFTILDKKVYANELLLSSHYQNICLLNGKNCRITQAEWDLIKTKKASVNDFFVLNKYKDERFTESECVFIDNFYNNVADILHERPLDVAVAHAVIMQFIMNSCYVGGRLNNGQIVAKLSHRLSHKRNHNNEMNFAKMQLKYFSVPKSQSICTNYDATEFLSQKNDFDLIYVDPPYGGAQSDYAYMYKFFEEYVVRKNFEDMNNLKIAAEKFCKAKNYGESFRNMLSRLPQKAIWVFSFNNSSWANIDFIKENISVYKTNVAEERIDYKYKYREAGNSEGIEYLLIAK